MAGLSTHVLDTVKGAGAAGMTVDVRSPDGTVHSVTLDPAGRAMLATHAQDGTYELGFHAGAYMGGHGFYDVIPIRFRAAAGQAYHVPLILSAFGYTTYRGG
jgi:5-hydroxyisourate hydrolase